MNTSGFFLFSSKKMPRGEREREKGRGGENVVLRHSERVKRREREVGEDGRSDAQPLRQQTALCPGTGACRLPAGHAASPHPLTKAARDPESCSS
ncbi:hypothetical protein JZ751_021386 [Albula glossodonta]|uniref:Uncharacterized protein n=1 Tax=Albula glossodonta TaxID=121402 RepID=A0A8T2NKJ3_9TELE|nr:hypothetical protein JZ751_021386 [Albula glossodonta]